MLETDLSRPRWAQEILRYSGVKPQFVLWGNVNDIYPVKLDDSCITLPLIPYLDHLLKEDGYELILRFQPLFGFDILQGTEEQLQAIAGKNLKALQDSSMVQTAEILQKICEQTQIPVAVLFSFGSRLSETCTQPERNEFFYRTWRLLLNSKPFTSKNSPSKLPRHNLIIWIMDKENDLPPWYALDNPRIHSLSIPRPDHPARGYIVNTCSPRIPGYNELSDNEQNEKKSLFLDQTGGMFASEILAVTQMAVREKIPFEQIDQAIRRYRTGIMENPWAKISQQIYEKAYDNLSSRVIGQEPAIRHAVDALKRSFYNLSGAQFSKNSQKPKGVLFLAGPTGVGKTELAKSITEMIFGSPNNYLRFDMSEFAHDHADQRLLGSPPGYVGYETGGELTNAVREKPFSLILFDEIEKGHPKILDIFLQILEDGRLTSGKGETVWFSETFIVFTSNLGVSALENPVQGSEKANIAYDDMKGQILDSIKDYFKTRINRPEILNRIGSNIIVFDYIRPETAGKIFEKMLSNIHHNLWNNHKIRIDFEPEILKKIQEICCADLSMGGRGIGNAMEAYLLNPLAASLFEISAQAGDYRVTSFDQDAVNLRIEKK